MQAGICAKSAQIHVYIKLQYKKHKVMFLFGTRIMFQKRERQVSSDTDRSRFVELILANCFHESLECGVPASGDVTGIYHARCGVDLGGDVAVFACHVIDHDLHCHSDQLNGAVDTGCAIHAVFNEF